MAELTTQPAFASTTPPVNLIPVGLKVIPAQCHAWNTCELRDETSHEGVANVDALNRKQPSIPQRFAQPPFTSQIKSKSLRNG